MRPAMTIYASSDSADMPLVALNAHLLSADASYRSAGVSQFIHGLMTYLPTADPTLRYAAFVNDERLRYPGWRLVPNHWAAANPLRRIVWEQLAQPRQTRRLPADLLHLPVNVGPLWLRSVGCPVVVTVHDLSFALYPQYFTRARRSYQQWLTPRTARQATAITADSQATKEDLVKLYGVDADRVRVVYPGVDARFRPVTDVREIDNLRQRRRLPAQFILFVGTIEPRKNLVMLLEAYAALVKHTDLPHALVIAGGKGWGYDAVFATAERLDLGERVIFPGYVPAGELPLWYNAADVVAYPSLYEGFGLPPLEAMACGTPVIVSSVSSLPEVVGDAGLLVDPGDPSAWAAALATMLTDPTARAKARQRGFVRAGLFTWERTARDMAQVYHEVLGA